MRPINLLAATVVGLIVCIAFSWLHAEELVPVNFMEELRSSDFERRQAAADKLLQLGENARKILEQAQVSDDLETRETALRLLSKLDKSQVSIMAFDRDGKPAGNAEADVQIYRADQRNWSEPSNKSLIFTGGGTAFMPDLIPGYVNLNFNWKKWGASDSSGYWTFYLERGVNPMIVQLSKGGTATGKISDADGNALKDATLYLYKDMHFDPDLLDLQIACLESRQQPVQNTLSGADGKFKIEGIPDGVYQAVARLNDYGAEVGDCVRIHEGEVKVLSEIKLAKRPAGKILAVLLAPEKQAAKKTQNVKKDAEPEKKPKTGSDSSPPPDGAEAEELHPLKKTKVFVIMDPIYSGPRAEELHKTSARLKTQLDMQRQLNTPESDDAGKLTLEDIKPGKYALTLRTGSQGTWKQAEVTVGPGQTVDLGSLKPVQCGSISGKITGPTGKEFKNARVSAVSQDDESDGLNRNWRFRQFDSGESSTGMVSQADGTYEIKNLIPGKYSLSITRPGKPILIYGLEVSPGKVTHAPDANVPGAVVDKVQEIVKGAVTLPDGKPAARASVILSWSNSPQWGNRTWPSNCDEQGKFQFSVGNQDMSPPNSLKVRAPGCKGYSLVLSDSKTKLTELAIQLEKQEYGSLRIKVIDDNGKPVSGASVRPAQPPNNQNYYRPPTVEKKIETNPAGEARLSGLADGLRCLEIHCEGYYTDGDIKANVKANAEETLTVTMKRGLIIAGKVEIPPGLAATQIVIMLTNQATRVSAVNEQGEFRFSGLSPADYQLYGVAPGMTPAERTKVSLKAGAPIENVKVKFVRMGGGAFNGGPALNGYSVALTPHKSWNPELSGDVFSWPASLAHGVADAAGRVEVWGAPPGEYDLVLSKNHTNYDTFYWNTAGKKCTLSTIAGPVQLTELKNISDLIAAPATEFKTQPGTATARGRIVSESASRILTNMGVLQLKIVGPNAFGTVSFSYPSEFGKQNNSSEALIIGTPPASHKENIPGSFLFEGLPPGEYKIYADVISYKNGWQVTEKKKSLPMPLRTFTVKEGENHELGTLSYSLSAERMEQNKNSDEFQMDPEDQIPIFQP